MDFDDIAFVGVIIFVVGMVALVIVWGILSMFLNGVGALDGQHVGYVTAVEDAKGLIFHDTVVYVKTDFESTQEDKYCVNDPEVKERLRQKALAKEQAVISFSNSLLLWRSECSRGATVIWAVE